MVERKVRLDRASDGVGVRLVIHEEDSREGLCDSLSRVYRLCEEELVGVGINFNGKVNLAEDERFKYLPAVKRYLEGCRGRE